MMPELLERIKARSIPQPDGCWLWMGALTAGKYPIMSVKNENCSVRQAAYQIANGAIPASTRISSTCRNMACVNPEHMQISGACCHGHDRAIHGYVNASGMRRCRACERDRYRRNKKRKGARP